MQISKRNNTAFKVLYLLKLLSEEPRQVDKLMFDLSIFDDEKICTKGVILKYINTLRVAGFGIHKEKQVNEHVYKIAKSPSKINFDDKDIQTLKNLKEHIKAYFSSKHKETYESFLNAIKPYLTSSQIAILNQEEQRGLISNFNFLDEDEKHMINKFSELTKDNQRVELYFKSMENDSLEKILIEPKGVHYIKNVIYFAGYSPVLNSTKLVPFNYVVKIDVLPSKSKFSLMRKDIVFKLIGRVAKGYNIRSNERLVEKEDSYAIISNNYEDKELLFKRLLRYGAYCEILYPQDIRNDFTQTLKEILNIYIK